MTDVKQDETQAAPSEAPEQAPQHPAIEALPGLAQALLAAASPTHGAIAKLVEQLSRGDNMGQLLSEAMAASEVPEVKALREKIKKAHDNINKWTEDAEAIVKPTLNVPSEEDQKKLDSEYKAKVQEFNGYDLVFKNEIGKSEELSDFSDLSLATFLGDVPRRKGKAASTAGASGISRPRVTSVEYGFGTNAESVEYKKVGDEDSSTFTHLAVELKKNISGYSVAASDFYPAWMTQNGLTENGDWRSLPALTTFAWSATDDKGKTHNIWVRVVK